MSNPFMKKNKNKNGTLLFYLPKSANLCYSQQLTLGGFANKCVTTAANAYGKTYLRDFVSVAGDAHPGY
jgi:hypothetical protein